MNKKRMENFMGFPTERGLNRGIIPIVKKPTENQKFPIEIETNPQKLDVSLNLHSKPGYIFRIDNYWDHKNFMLMDAITLQICKQLFGRFIPKTIDQRVYNNAATEENVQEFLELAKSQSLVLTKEDIKEIPYFRTCALNYIDDIIDNLKNCRLSLSYDTRMFNPNTKSFYHKQYYFQDFNLLFSEVQKLKNHSYKFYFNTPISRLYLLNIAQLNVDFLDESVYRLPKLTHLFYRCVISSSKNKSKVKRFHINEIRDKLNMKSNVYLAKNSIKKMLEILKSNELISNYSFSYKDNIKSESRLVVDIEDPRIKEQPKIQVSSEEIDF